MPGESNTFVRPFRVSTAAKPGPALYRVEIEDICNPLQLIWPIRRTQEAAFVIGEAPQRGVQMHPAEGLARHVLRRFALV